MKLAFARAEAYKKEKKKSTPISEQNPVPKSTGGANACGDPDSEAPEDVELAFEKAKEYKNQKGAVGGQGGDGNAAVEKPRDSGILQKLLAVILVRVDIGMRIHGWSLIGVEWNGRL